MKESAFKTSMVKEVAIIVICLILGLVGASFAKGGEEVKRVTASLAADELALYQKIDAEYQDHIEVVVEEIEHPKASFDRVEIYDMAGTLLKSIDLEGKHFNEQMLLPHANHIVTEGRVAVYMIL